MSARPAVVAGAEWTLASGPEADVVMSSRVRLARNLAGARFPSSARDSDRVSTLAAIREAALALDLASVPGARPGDRLSWVDLNDAPPIERLLLVERHLISKQHARGVDPRAVCVSGPTEWLSVMVNEEDHIRLQAIRSGLALRDALARADAVDDFFESRLAYAFSVRWGYLTACPTNVGTGLRVSVMLHLPALKAMQQIDKVRRAAKAMNLALRGFYGEGSEFAGDIYQLSNQTTLGKSEPEILDEFETRIVPEVIDYERRAREALLAKRRTLLEDQVQRAMGILTHARLLSADEALQHLSSVRLGVETGLLSGLSLAGVNELFLLTQPAHLQKASGREMDQAERRIARATLVRERLRR